MIGKLKPEASQHGKCSLQPHQTGSDAESVGRRERPSRKSAGTPLHGHFGLLHDELHCPRRGEPCSRVKDYTGTRYLSVRRSNMALYVITGSTSDTRICCTSFMTITAEERLAQTTRGNFAECSMLFSGLRGKVGRKLLLFVMTRNTPRTSQRNMEASQKH